MYSSVSCSKFELFGKSRPIDERSRDLPVIPFPAVATAAAVSSNAAFSAAERNVPPTVNAVTWLIVIATSNSEKVPTPKFIVLICFQKLCDMVRFLQGASDHEAIPLNNFELID